jgi:hypothetical protein
MRTASAGTYDSDSLVLAQGSNQVGFRLVCSVVPPESTGGSGGDPSNNSPNEQASNQRTWVQWWDTCPWYEKVVIGVGGVAAVVTVATVGAAVASGVDVPAAVVEGARWLFGIGAIDGLSYAESNEFSALERKVMGGISKPAEYRRYSELFDRAFNFRKP